MFGPSQYRQCLNLYFLQQQSIRSALFLSFDFIFYQFYYVLHLRTVPRKALYSPRLPTGEAMLPKIG